MKLLFVRHADPDYSIDSLTEVGKKEAEALSRRLVAEKPDDIYCSILGRARDTLKPTLEKLGATATYCDWLREFNYANIQPSYCPEPRIPWDLLPDFAAKQEGLFSPTEWRNLDFIKNSNTLECYDEVTKKLDAVLARHGYLRDGANYRAERPNHNTILFVCHYGVICVLLSHLLNCSPYVLWQQAVALPSSVSCFYTEERAQGIASLRMSQFADTGHLFAAGLIPSFAGRFCECFTDETRH